MATGVSFDFRKLTWDIGGESSQWWGPMAVAVIFGLGFATLLTLIVVPVLCSVVDSVKNRKAGLKKKSIRRKELIDETIGVQRLA